MINLQHFQYNWTHDSTYVDEMVRCNAELFQHTLDCFGVALISHRLFEVGVATCGIHKQLYIEPISVLCEVWTTISLELAAYLEPYH